MIETIEDWNTRLEYCGCCEMPVCPAPVMVCEGKTGSADCSDYEGDPDPAYDYGCFLPFVAPSVGPNDDIPTIYQRKKDEGAKDNYSGQYSSQNNDNLVSTITAQVTSVSSFNSDNTPVRNTFSQTTQWDSNISSGGALPGGVESTYSSISTDGGVDTTRWGLNSLSIAVNDITATVKRLGIQTATTNNGPIHTHETTGPYSSKSENRSVGTREKYTSSSELSQEISKSGLITRAEGEMPEEWSEGGCAAIRDLSWPTLSEAEASLGGSWPSDGGGTDALESPTVSASVTAFRFRFRIPYTHTGSKFTITYDVAEFPQDEDVDPFFVSEDNVVEWTGPGDQEDPEGNSWLTPWVEIDPPEESGERRIVNIRYTCYTGAKFGVKPQVMGEAFEPPAP